MGAGNESIAENLEETQSTKTFHEAVKTAGLTSMLADQSGPYTVFAPTEQAFQALGEQKRKELMDNPERLKRVLKYHIISGKKMADGIKAGEVETLEGTKVRVEVSNDGEKITFQGADIQQTDISANNGVIHTIDKVILPPEQGGAM